MDEIKSMIAYLRNVNAAVGYVKKNSYSAEVICMDAVVGYAELTAEADRLQKRAEELQDEIDVFNALTQVSLP